MSNKIQYDSYAKTIDGTNYCAGVETIAQNLIEDNENDSTIIFPSTDGWATPRTETFKLTTENCRLILPEKIYKIKNVSLFVPECKVVWRDGKTRNLYTEFENASGEKIHFFDITRFVMNDNERLVLKQSPKNTLGNPTSATRGEEGKLLYISNTFSYSQNSNIINIDGKSYKGRDDWFGEWVEPVYLQLLNSWLIYYGEDYTVSGSSFDTRLASYAVDSISDIRQWKFRVSYIPITSETRIRVRKNAKTNVDYIQPINQRAEVNSASALGKFLQSTANKTGTGRLVLVKRYTHLADIPPVGCRVRHEGKHYILTANSYSMTNTVYIQVTHVLSENWSNKAQRTDIDQKYRNYKIPADIVWRNLYWEDFVEVKSDGVVQGATAGEIISKDYPSVSETKTVTAAFPVPTAGGIRVAKFEETFNFVGGTIQNAVVTAYPSESVGAVSISFTGNSYTLSGTASDEGNYNITVKITMYGQSELSRIFQCSRVGDTAVTSFFISDADKTDGALGATVPCMTLGMANSMLFSASMKDQLSAGLRMNADNPDYCEEVFYCNEDGKLMRGKVVLAGGVNVEESSYPQYRIDNGVEKNGPVEKIFQENFHIDKDSAEALKFTYQVHFVSEEPDIVIGNKIAENHPLVKKWATDRKFRFWALTRRLRQGVDKVYQSDGTSVEIDSDSARESYWTISSLDTATLKAFNIALGSAGIAAISAAGCKGWAITSEDGDLYIGSNDAGVTTLYFTHIHARK